MGLGNGADEFDRIVRTPITDHDHLVVDLAAFEEVGHCLQRGDDARARCRPE